MLLAGTDELGYLLGKAPRSPAGNRTIRRVSTRWRAPVERWPRAEPTRRGMRQSRMNHTFRSALAIVTLGLVLAACSVGGATPCRPSRRPPPGDPGIGHPEPGGVGAGRTAARPAERPSRRARAARRDRIRHDGQHRRVLDERRRPVLRARPDQVNVNDDQTVDVTVVEGHVGSGRHLRDDGRGKHTIVSFEVPGTGTWDDPRLARWCPPVEVVVS